MFKLDKIQIKMGLSKSISCDSLNIDRGIWALVGRNGAGKSTFLKALIGDKQLESGSVILKNQPINLFTSLELSKCISVVYTKSTIFGTHTVFDVIALGRLPYQKYSGRLSDADTLAINNAIDLLNINSLSTNSFNTLSDGEKQLVMIARAIAQDTECILLDEPTAFLDLVNRKKVIKILSDISNTTGKLIVFSTHDIESIQKYCDGLIMINKGYITSTTANANFNIELEKIFIDDI